MLEITLLADRSNAEQIGDMLMDAGAMSYTTQDADADTPDEKPLFGEPGLEPETQAWDRSVISVLADDSFDWKTAVSVIEKTIGKGLLEIKGAAPVPDVDWVRVTQAQFQPIQASRRLWIVPSWSESPAPDALNMKMDPGVAFGTGSHPTTHMCIQWLDENLPKGSSVLDYGCGTGILAIAAAMFGASEVLGSDIDPLAVESARFNAENNGVAGRFELPEGVPAGRKFDTVIANILCNPLIGLAPELLSHLKDGGNLVLSGILSNQVEELARAYHEADPSVSLKVWRTEEDWNVLWAKKALSC